VIFDGVLVLGAVIGLWWLGKGAQTSPFESSYALSGLGAVALLATASVAAIGRAGLTTRSSWVIGTIATPTSVSALLHAGVVNAGALLILRAQGLTGSIWWIEILTAALCFTVLVMLAPRIHARVDLKGQLATSTISQMAFMLLALSLGWPLIALTHLIGHGLYKATRFMAAGGAIEARSRRRRRAPSGNRIENHVRILGSAGIVLTASALAMTLHGDVLTAMGVLAPGAVAVWWVRTKEPILQPFMSWLLLALGLTFYGAFVAGAELFLEPSLPSGLWQAPWSVLGVITGAVSLISILRHSREPITAGSKISRIQLFLHPKLREAA
jgi:NAD(P)H-quinone oxidoreductase subunit 5